MKRAHNGLGVFLKDGKIQALCLGWDFTSEHEWGIRHLEYDFECLNEKEAGIERYRVKQVPEGFTLTLTEKGTYLGTHPPMEGPSWPHPELRTYKGMEVPFTAAWDRGSFGLFTTDPEMQAHLQELHEAFLKNDVALYLQNSKYGGMAQGGLVLSIISRTPKHDLNVMRKAHQDAATLKRYVAKVEKKSRLRETLSAAGCRWYCLSPKRVDPSEKSAYDIKYWLNPVDQHRNNYGFFTVEELLQWAEGGGPVPK